MPQVTIAKAPHTLSVGTTKVGVILPDQYSALSSVLGIDKVTTGNKPDLSSSVRDLMRSGQAIKIRVSYAVGTRRVTTDLLCAIDKAKTAVTELVGKTIRGSTIKTAYFPQRARFS